jgi:hypothetical protein
MRPRIKKDSLTPSSMKVFSTFTTPEEQEKLYERRQLMKEYDSLGINKSKNYYVRIFGREMQLSLEEINKCGFIYYTK